MGLVTAMNTNPSTGVVGSQRRRPRADEGRYTSPGGKSTHARVQRVAQPDVTEIRTWRAHERIAVRRG